MSIDESLSPKEKAKQYIYDMAYHLNIPVDSQGQLLKDAFKLVDYYKVEVEENKRLVRDIEKRGLEYAKSSLWFHRDYHEKNFNIARQKLEEYKQLFEQIESWKTTSEEIESLKEKCLHSLQEYIDAEQSKIDYYNPDKLPTVEEWLDLEFERASQNLTFSQNEYQRYLKRKEEILLLAEKLNDSVSQL